MIARAIQASERAVIPYLTAGLPDLETTGRLLEALASSGAPLIELGLPFSDPMADGPVLQEASYRALKAGFTLDAFCAHLREWTIASPVPLVVMSYLNPLMRQGLEATLARLSECGLYGVIIPDLPKDAGEIFTLSEAYGLDLIRLAAPTTTEGRLREILPVCRGFVYAVAFKGVTGARQSLPATLPSQVRRIKALTDLPVCVGFGVSLPSQVTEILREADGVIVGSHLMQALLEDGDPVAALQRTYAALREGGD